MKKRLFLVLAILSSLSLSACQTEFVFPSEADLSKDYVLLRNGDLLADGPDDYESFTHRSVASSIIQRIAGGEDVLFLFASDACHVCADSKDFLASTIRRLGVELNLIYGNTYNEAGDLNAFIANSGIAKRVGEHPMSGATPSLYLLSDQTLTEVMYGVSGSPSNVDNVISASLQSYATLCQTYVYESAAPFLSTATEEVLLYAFDQGDEQAYRFFHESLLPVSRGSNKRLLVANITNMGDEDKISLATAFGTEAAALSGSLRHEETAVRYDGQSVDELLSGYFS